MEDLIKTSMFIDTEGNASLAIDYKQKEMFSCIDWITPRPTLESILENQLKVIKLYKESNDEIMSFNELSEMKFKSVSQSFKKKIPVIKKVFQDLGAIHKSIQEMKKKLNIRT
jgi:hypothetical protein